ncbi:cuticle protein 10.9 [Nephila pilipes]|uniref:Cuticle protein 10.9 n=1 Tax=Nephila pilipes TaxID=299642 RepID=A0A8X6N668_NEPPI|nr:cuticle protein 10.9 [Nephila pilipes]
MYRSNSIARRAYDDGALAEESGLSDEELTNPVPYNFQYNHQDNFGNVQHREENKNEDGVIRGSYGYRDPMGMYRHVSYIADANGFHAVLRTNEPGIENKNSADVAVVAHLPSYTYRRSKQDASPSDNYR